MQGDRYESNFILLLVDIQYSASLLEHTIFSPVGVFGAFSKYHVLAYFMLT